MKTKTEIAEKVARYVLAMMRDGRHLECKYRLESMIDLFDYCKAADYTMFAEDCIEALCDYQPLEVDYASDV